MPLCEKCRKFFPPDFCTQVGDEDFLCEWCVRDVDEIIVTPQQGKQYKYTREECVKEYKRFIGQLKDSKNVKKILDKEKERS